MTTSPTYLLLLAPLVALAACTDPSEKGLEDVDPEIACASATDGVVRATGSLTNHSSSTSSYFVDIEFFVGDRSIDTRTAVVEGVAPGDTVPVEVTVRDAPPGPARCELVSADRMKA
jgi:hypothetical protein